MDLRKVFDQTVRELKREVNKKVLKVPEIEQKVLDATSNEPWGPHGTLMSEIAQATRNYGECQMILSILWKRLADTGKNWRHVYKSLTVMEYIVAHGADKAIDELRENVSQIQGLLDFQYIEPSNGRDEGINVRKKAQTLVGLLSDKTKIRETRQKAASNKDKYHGFSSSGTGSKPSTFSRGWNDDKYSGNGGYGSGDKYGGSSSPGRYNDGDDYDRHSDHGLRKKEDSPRAYERSPPKGTAAPKKTSTFDDDDFDPRASSAAPATTAPAPPPKVEFDLLDLSSPTFSTNASHAAVDPFATEFFSSASTTTTKTTTFTAFQSAPGTSETKFSPFASSDFKAFTPPSVSAPAASDPFAAFENLHDEVKPQANQAKFAAFEDENGDFEAFGDFQDSEAAANGTSNGTTNGVATKFEAKSGSIWDDPLSSGLINLNISAPKSAALADLGIQTSDWSFDDLKPKDTPQSKPMGVGAGFNATTSPDPFLAFQDDWKILH